MFANGWAMFSAALKHVLFKFASSQFVQRNISNLVLIRQRRIGGVATTSRSTKNR